MQKMTLFVTTLAMLALASGCGRDKAQVAVNTKDAKITVAGGNASVALPDNFPKDVPIMPGASVKSVIKTQDVTSVTATVSASPQEAAKYYQDSLTSQGWKVENTLAVNNVTMMTVAKDKREVTLQIGTSDGKTAAIMIALRSKD